jgi:hypothetical protein
MRIRRPGSWSAGGAGRETVSFRGGRPVSRSTVFVLVLAAIGSGVAASAARAGRPSTTLCVAARPGCYSTLQAAVDAAKDGDTITVAPGTYPGGVTVDVSVAIVGAGAAATTIKGGGPVLTLGKEFATVEPTISIRGVTITGGRNTSVPDHAVTQGGGIRIPQAASFTTGATVTIRDSVVTHNSAASEQLLPAGFCGPFDCSFTSGGGISNDGRLTLINTAVTDNIAGDPALVTVAAGEGGISNTQRGTLTLRHCVVTGNRAIGAPPWGNQANAGGIGSDGPMTIDDSIVSDNHAQLSTTFPSDAGPLAFAGGIALSNGSDAISRTTIARNTVEGSFLNSDALAFGGGVFVDGDASLSLDRVAIAQNRVDARIPQTSPGSTLAGGGGLSINGVVTIRDSRIALNHISVSAPAGTVLASGGGIANFGQTTLTRTLVIANGIDGNASTGSLDGGGITNKALFGPPAILALTDSVVVGNTLKGSPGISLKGGGVFTDSPIGTSGTVIAGNKPDQCFGC